MKVCVPGSVGVGFGGGVIVFDVDASEEILNVVVREGEELLVSDSAAVMTSDMDSVVVNDFGPVAENIVKVTDCEISLEAETVSYSVKVCERTLVFVREDDTLWSAVVVTVSDGERSTDTLKVSESLMVTTSERDAVMLRD